MEKLQDKNIRQYDQKSDYSYSQSHEIANGGQLLPLREKQLAMTSNKCKTSYFWTKQENIRYREFLEANTSLFEKSMLQRKSLKINVLMSRYIKTRNALQCRSHHQKMLKFKGSLRGIITYIKNEQESSAKNELNNSFSITLQINQAKTSGGQFDLRYIEENDYILAHHSAKTLWQKLTEDNYDLNFLWDNLE